MKRALLIAVMFPLLAMSLPTQDKGSVCAGKKGKDLSHCIIDTRKQWGRERTSYDRAEEVRHAAWHDVHDKEGITDEYRAMHQQVHNQMRERRAAWNARNEEQERMLDNERRTARHVGQRRKTDGAIVTPEDETRCMRYAKERQRIVCMKTLRTKRVMVSPDEGSELRVTRSE